MNSTELNKKIQEQSLPLMVEIWAPWCMPCKLMQPQFHSIAKEYAGKIELLRINADENPDLIQDLKVFGVPTILGYKDQKLIFRRSGSQSKKQLQHLAEVLLGNESSMPMISITDRIVRSAAGLALLWMGSTISPSWLWFGLGALLIFSAFYDRCPVFQAILRQLKKQNLSPPSS